MDTLLESLTLQLLSSYRFRKQHHVNLQDLRAVKIEALSARAGMPLIYIPKGGVVRITFDASPAQLEQVAAGLADMGLKTVERTKVKTASDAANGNLLSPAVIAARHAAPGAFVAARRRVPHTRGTTHVCRA